MKSTLRTTGWTAVAAAALLLAGCASSVKLDEAPVESRTPSAVDGTAGKPGGTTGSTAGTATPQSQVAAVDLTKGAASAAASAGRVVYFDFDSFVVKDEFRNLVDTHARALAANKGKRMMIEGHTDERGGREYNLALGQKRAEAVAKSMVLLGVGETQVEAVSFGKERPVSEGHDEGAWAKNRRAELKDK
ncbi:peptidoglycan-associated lipoprotein Pal [Ideonella sp. A 288]|uniref:peptidoglycan-associated lipoprotein Pal n=1 Tax=Ideonella sp. A 288 TaxID=1962181 RepID=UPI000B4A7052|nr:peptidoglycan-associated lipoprotein Pal [Ideonella sp. A 288]